MGNVWGRNIRLTIFGESHGEAIGMVIGGLPPGIAPDWEHVAYEMARRAPGNSILSTARKESDSWEVLSGIFNGRTTGAPLSVIIRNENARSGDYEPDVMRPGHADLSARYKYKGFSDYRGGGHFSGRLTAPLVLAGALAKQVLEGYGIKIGARIQQIGQICDLELSAEQIVEISKKAFPVYSEMAAEAMREAVVKAASDRDSVGGVIECVALGVGGGYGEPFFDSLESSVSSMMFSIPAVKGIEFGDGFKLGTMSGSEANDQMYMNDKGGVGFYSNHNGGILGGITNGQPVEFRVVIKPTPTIGRPQTTVDIAKGETMTAGFGGRHDPCIVPRALPVVEAGLALCLLDALQITG